MRSEHGEGDQPSAGTPEPLSEDMEWSRLQGLYGGSEYGGYVGDPERPDRSYAGKGPKGWQRTDNRLLDDVNEALARHPAIDASDVEVAVDGTQVILRGEVSDGRTRELAKESAAGVDGVDVVRDELRLRTAPATPRDGASGPGDRGEASP